MFQRTLSVILKDIENTPQDDHLFRSQRELLNAELRDKAHALIYHKQREGFYSAPSCDGYSIFDAYHNACATGPTVIAAWANLQNNL